MQEGNPASHLRLVRRGRQLKSSESAARSSTRRASWFAATSTLAHWTTHTGGAAPTPTPRVRVGGQAVRVAW